MNKHKLHFLAIAPSESIQSLLYDIVSSIDNVSLDAFVGNLYTAVEIVRQSEQKHYDCILSRGETASMIRQITSIPVVEFPLSFYDILHSMKLAENFREPYAIVGFSPLANNARLLCDMMQSDTEIFTLSSLEDAVPVMQQIKKKGYKLIISGMGTESIARQNGINSILITTGRDSLASAIDQAIRLCASLSVVKKQEEFLYQILANTDQEILVFNEQKEPVFSTLKTLKQEHVLPIVTRRLQNPQIADSTIIKNIRGKSVTIQERTITIGEENYILFTFLPQPKAYTATKNEIRIFSREEAIDTFLSHYLELPTCGHNSLESMPHIIHSPYPVMLLGEEGTGKEQLAASIYTKGNFQNHPYSIIDFSLATEKTWNYLQNHVNSPINNEAVTIYFRNLEKLPPSKIDKLRILLSDTGSCRRNKVIFSFTSIPGNPLPEYIQNLINLFSCHIFSSPPLRERTADIRPLSGLYISTANIVMAKQVIGFTPEAMTLLEQYNWPGNLTQFKRIITHLVSITTSSYIQEEHVKKALEDECGEASKYALSNILDLNKPLQEIEKTIVRAVLEENGGNQSKAAASLGICRATLWKMIKN